MKHPKATSGSIAVIFSSQRTAFDDAGYAAASDEMAALAATQAGYIAVESTRGADGLGITISYWQDESSAQAWRYHPRHTEIRERGRAVWYDSYQIHIATIIREYGWTRRDA